jgi:hypothetical protein
MTGGAGNDTFIVDNVGDITTEAAGAGSGIDLVESSVTRALTNVNLENLTLTGGAAINGTGNVNINIILGNGANNTLTGLGGNDTLNSGAGADTLIGGAGGDNLIGGAGGDNFIYNAVTDSGPAAAQRDIINGFDVPGAGAGDLLNLTAIDAHYWGRRRSVCIPRSDPESISASNCGRLSVVTQRSPARRSSMAISMAIMLRKLPFVSPTARFCQVFTVHWTSRSSILYH